jgi:catechol 2,3-dioxygenase-like lactoylglutathione lyase family enzyme
MPIPPRVSVVALRTADLARSTAFYSALGWQLSPASTAAMSLFKTAGSLLLVCTDELLAELGGQEVAGALAGEPTGEAVLSIHLATDGEVDAALQEAVRAGGVVIKRAAPPPWAGHTRSSPTPTAMCGRSSTTRSTSSGPMGGPRSRRPGLPPDTPSGTRLRVGHSGRPAATLARLKPALL